MAIPNPPVKNGIPAPPNKEVKIVTQERTVYLDGNVRVQPPSAVELEAVILGALMIDKNGLDLVDLIEPELFFSRSNQHVATAIKNLYKQDIGVDILTVCNELRRMDVLDLIGGEYYIIQLTQKVSSSAHTEFHIRIVMQKYVLRSLVMLGQETIKNALYHDPDIFDLLDKWAFELAKIKDFTERGKKKQLKLTPMQELVRKRELKALGLTIGVPTGVSELDDFSGGFRPRELITIAARPGMGKTTWLISLMVFAVIYRKYKVVFYSLEMSDTDVKNRIAASLTGIPFDRINSGDVNDKEMDMMEAAFLRIEESNMKIIDTSEHKNDFYRICKSVREHIAEGYEEVLLDYVQLVKMGSGKGGDRTQELNTITREFKALANELDFPFVQLAQLSRGPDTRPGHRPLLSDLKQSGSIEEDSDVVIFLLRMAYYEKTKNAIPPPPNKPNPEYLMEIIVAKGRSIGTKDFSAYCDFKKVKVNSYSDNDF